jgi:hypothetical protein
MLKEIAIKWCWGCQVTEDRKWMEVARTFSNGATGYIANRCKATYESILSGFEMVNFTHSDSPFTYASARGY